jgi:hypothetical protein
MVPVPESGGPYPEVCRPSNGRRNLRARPRILGDGVRRSFGGSRPNLVVPRPASESAKRSFTKFWFGLWSTHLGHSTALARFSKADLTSASAFDHRKRRHRLTALSAFSPSFTESPCLDVKASIAERKPACVGRVLVFSVWGRQSNPRE